MLALFVVGTGAALPGFSASAQAASGLNLAPAQRLNFAGQPGVSALLPLADGGRLICAGSRWVMVSASGTLLQSATLSAECQGLSLSTSGKQFMTVTAQGVSLWNISDGRKVADLPLRGAAGRVGLSSDTQLLLATDTDLRQLDWATGKATILRPGAVQALFVSPDGQRAVLGDGKRVQLVSLPDFKVLSGAPCDAACTPANAHFSLDGRTAAVLVGSQLWGLRDGVPSSIILHGIEGSAVGLPQPDNTVLTFAGGNIESHDFQTGRREQLLRQGGVLPVAEQCAAGRIVALSATGELLDGNLNSKAAALAPGSLNWPAQVSAGGLSASGQVYALSGGRLGLGAATGTGVSAVPGTYWAIQSAGKTVWALASAGDGGLSTGTLSGSSFSALPGSRPATTLALNIWGNTAATWDDTTLSVFAAGKPKPVAQLSLSSSSSSGNAVVALSADGTRAYVIGKNAATSSVITIAGGKRAPLPYALPPEPVVAAQVSGKGIMMLVTDNKVMLYRPNEKQAYLSLPGSGVQARFSPNGQYLALPRLGQSGPQLDIVDISSGKTLGSSAALANWPGFVAWSTDGQKLAVGASLAQELGSATVFTVTP